jgi:hypothetical protein
VSSFIYVLQHAYEDRIKIGYSVNPVARARSLPDQIDYDRSFQLAIDGRCVTRVEKMLHFAARRFRVTPEHDGDGSTEWFAPEAIRVVRSIVERHPEMFPHGSLTSLERSGLHLTTIESDDPRAYAINLFVAKYDGRLRYAFGARAWYEWDEDNQWWVKLAHPHARLYLYEVSRVGDFLLLPSTSALDSALDIARSNPAFSSYDAPHPNQTNVLRKAARLQFKRKKTADEAAWYKDFQNEGAGRSRRRERKRLDDEWRAQTT